MKGTQEIEREESILEKGHLNQVFTCEPELAGCGRAGRSPTERAGFSHQLEMSWGMADKGHSRRLCTPLGKGARQEGGEVAGEADGGRAEEAFSEEGGNCTLPPLASGSQLARLSR